MTPRPPAPYRNTLARWILRAYPGAWRRRYETEALDAVQSRPMSWREVGQLAATGIEEYFRSAARSADHRAATAILFRAVLAVLAVYATEVAFRLVQFLVMAPAVMGLRLWLGTSISDVPELFYRMTLGSVRSLPAFAVILGVPALVLAAIARRGVRLPSVARVLAAVGLMAVPVWLELTSPLIRWRDFLNLDFAAMTLGAWVFGFVLFPRRAWFAGPPSTATIGDHDAPVDPSASAGRSDSLSVMVTS